MGHKMDKETEKNLLYSELAKARGGIIIASGFGSSIKKYVKAGRAAIKRMRELGEDGLADAMERSLEEIIRKTKN